MIVKLHNPDDAESHFFVDGVEVLIGARSGAVLDLKEETIGKIKESHPALEVAPATEEELKAFQKPPPKAKKLGKAKKGAKT